MLSEGRPKRAIDPFFLIKKNPVLFASGEAKREDNVEVEFWVHSGDGTIRKPRNGGQADGIY